MFFIWKHITFWTMGISHKKFNVPVRGKSVKKCFVAKKLLLNQCVQHVSLDFMGVASHNFFDVGV